MKRASVVRRFRCGSGDLGAVEPGGRGGGWWLWIFWVGFVVWGFGYVGEIERGKMTILDDAKGGGGGGGCLVWVLWSVLSVWGVGGGYQ